MLTSIRRRLRVEYHQPLARKELNPPEFTPSTREREPRLSDRGPIEAAVRRFSVPDTVNHGYPTVDPLKPGGRIVIVPVVNHGYPTVDPLKPYTGGVHSPLDVNHGYPTVDPLKPTSLACPSIR